MLVFKVNVSGLKSGLPISQSHRQSVNEILSSHDAPFQLLTEHSKASLGGEFEMLSGKKGFARGGTFLVVSHGGR